MSSQCTLPKDLNTCRFYIPDQCACSRSDKCSFQKEDAPTENKTGYVRKERWYEQYYKNRLGKK